MKKKKLFLTSNDSVALDYKVSQNGAWTTTLEQYSDVILDFMT